MAPGGSQTTVGVTVVANMDASGILGGVKSMQSAFNGLKLPANLTGDAIKQFDKLKESLTKYRQLMEKGPSTKADLKQLEKLEKTIKGSFDSLNQVYDELSGKKIYLEADATAIKNAQKDIDQLKQDVQNKLGSIKFEFSSPVKGKVDIGLNELISDMEHAVKSSKTVSASMKEMTNSIKSGNFTDAAKGLTQIEQQATKLKGASIGLLKTFQQMGLIQFNKSAEDLYKSGQHVNLLHQGFEKLHGALSADDVELKQFVKSLNDAIDKKSDLEKTGEKNYQDSLSKTFASEEHNLKGMAQGYDQCADAARRFAQQSMSAAQQVEQLQQSTQYFFSLRNMINLLKRGIDEAVQSVKDLDKAMTETAVVTDYKVSDLWGMLPEYTKIANQLGATTQGAYETMTLYYQQGLEQQQAFELGAETMKMARIAGLDYAETTDMMTAALRGFNMELNETSAKRVNDVYSELAAITASDTEELGTAMQRTASIAASAGASFEGTTAFLAQAIETTREPAENIGTAMKTIVARFQEMKKNPLEISEVDGEEVDYNKIDAALKTIGVDLKDTNGQFRNFDEVMLDISAKWDTLSQSQQRYIATTAAGSRQQSRFIAMVSNYERTMQLMEAANNSAGASDEQFGKTMDSLESKLNQLHNAWQAFTMGIANNGMIKLAVDGLTGFLTVTNKIIDVLSLGSGALKSFLSVFAAFTGLKIAGRGANALIGGLGGLVDPQSSMKEGLKIGLFGQGKNAAQAKAITTPIVGSLTKISGQIAAIAKRQGIKDAGQKGSTAGVKETSKEDYANTKRLFSQLSGKEGFKMGDTSKLFGGLDAKHQLSMFNNSPGTKLAMKQASLNWFDSKGLSKELTNEGKQFINSIYKGMSQGQIPVDKGIELIGQPQKWGQYFGTNMAKGFSSSFAKESTQQAHQQAMQYLVGNPDAYGFRSNEFKDWYNNQATDAQKEAYAKYFRQAIDKRQGHGEAKGVVSDMGRFANDIGSVADKFTQAGYGITTFGNALSQLGGPLGTIGSGIAAFGGAISTIGASISGATGIISLFTVGITDATGAVVVAGSTIAAVAAPLAAVAATFLLVRAHIKKVKEAGEEVTKTFNETNKTVSDNITKLKSYQSEFAVLSKGVDANGNNVSLDDSQYQRYLEIVEDIAAINPEIVEGYNAQGHAIINNNKALAETLKLQEESQKKALQNYIDTDSLQKLINARNLNNDFKGINVKGSSPGVYDGSGHGSEGRQKPIGLGKDVSTIADQLRLIQGTDALGNTIRVNDEMLQKYGIESLDALISGEEQAVKNFIKHRDKIQADLTNSGFELSESITKGFETLDKDAGAFDEAIKPVYDNLLANVSNSKVFESIAPEFREAFNMGLKDLASQDLSASEMSKEANNMAARFANLTTGSGKYADALKIVEKAQDNFAATLNETKYEADVQPAIDDLTRLKEEALEEGTAYGDALAEYLENQIEKISRFTEEGSISLSEALNTMQDDIAAAEGALESFQESTKTDYSTAASGMKSIFEEIFKETDGIQLHTEGFGDQTFWKGAKELLSQDIIDTGNIDTVVSKLNKIKPALEDGQDGWENFLDIVENTQGMDKWFKFFDDGTYTIDIPEEEFSEVAKQLGVSENFLTSMLNKGRQFAEISFSNIDSVRKALASSDTTIKGQGFADSGDRNLYVKEESLRTELFNQGYVNKKDQDTQIAKYLERGIKTIPAADSNEMTKKDWQGFANDWGIKTLPDLIKTLNDTGEFTKDEIKAYADKMGFLGTDAGFEQDYSDIISATENPELTKQTSELQSINAKVGALLDKRSSKEQTSAWQDFHNMIYGKKGVDTDFQHFGRGENSKGQALDAGEYATTRKNMQDAIKTAEEASQKYKYMAEQSSGADKKHFDDLSKKYDSDAQHIKALMDEGDKAYAEAQKRIELERQAKQSKDQGRAQERQLQQQTSNNQAQKGAQATNKKEKSQTNTTINNTEENKTVHEKTIYEAEVDPQLEDLNAKYGYDRTTQAIVNYLTKGEEDLQLAEDEISHIDLATQDPKQIMIEANTNGVSIAAAALNTLPKSKTVSIGLNTSGFMTKIASVISRLNAVAEKARNAKLGGTAAGHDNSFKAIPIPTFQSAAKGKGHVGPKNHGGLTLTGEEGYEIAWLPSEGTSMILGAAGPQMINLPADAVVYTHEQSEDILKKRQTIEAGSHSGEATGSGKRKTKKSKSKSKSKKKSKKSKKSKGSSKNTTPTINNWSIEEAVQYNIDESLASITEEISLRTKEIEKNLEKVGTTYKDIVGTTQAQIAALEQVKQKNQELLVSNQRQLADYRAQQQYVSWTDGNGESQRTLINIAQYLNADGSVNTGAIAGLNNRALEEAVYKEVSSAKAMVDGIRNAQKAIADANDQIADLGKKISEAFYQWENELTEVYSLTKRINNEVSFTNRFTSQVELELAKLGAGFTDTAKAIANTRNVLIRNNATIQAQIKNQQQMVAARQRELEAALSYEDEVSKLNKFQNQTGVDSATKQANIEWAQNLAEGATLGYKYVTGLFKDIDGSIQYQIDWEQFNADNEADPYSKTTYEAIKKYLDELDSAATEFNNSIKDQTDFIKQTYDALKEYQDYIADMEDTLIKGVEEQIEQAKDNAKQLSDSITSALKDLLDEVKRKLDERRKQEDNAKTERDISQKQQRLAMLRADTAGGHQVEIAQLEKEIADSQQSYQRTLEDQLLDRLQQQADEASEQRERQIALMEAGNQIDASTNKELVDMWLKDPEKYKEEIKAAWLEAQGYDEKGEAGQYVLESQFESDFAQLVTAVEESNFKDSFNALTADTNSLAALLNDLTNGQLGRQDELAHSTNALLDVTDRNTTSILTEMQKQNSAAMLKAKGADASTLKTLGYTAQQMLEGNYTPEELRQAGYTAKELAEGGLTDVSALKNAGYGAEDIKEANVGNASDFKEAGFTAEELKDLFSLDELVDASYDAKALKNAGYDAGALKGEGFNIQQLKDAGYTLPQLKNAFSAIEFGAGGMTYADAKAAGYGLNDLKPVTEYAVQAQQEQAAIDAQNAWNAKVNAYNSAIYAAHARGTVDKYTFSDAINKGAAIGYGVATVASHLAAGDGSGGVTWKEVAKAAKKLGYGRTTVASWSPGSSALKNATTKKQWKKYATGGLADYTGPAWLDGTPSKPELVLNSADTKNFLALRDVLSSAMKSTSAVTNSYGGDVMYDINIHVDKIEKDYDVDKVVDKVKKEITKGAGYRNVTQVRNFK